MSGWQTLVPGAAEGEVLVLVEPLSFWGGFDPSSGKIVDVHHPQLGESLAGKVVVMPHARGSSSTSGALAEGIRRGTGPVAILLGQPDEIVVVGAIVPGELYNVWCPVLVDLGGWYRQFESGQRVRVSAGTVDFVN